MNEIIINKENDINSVLLISNGILVEKYQYKNEKTELEGNIYIGIIKDILIGMQAAFVDIGENKNAFIHIEDILGKDYSKKDLSKIKVGMPIMVQVKKAAIDTKGARVTTNIQISGRFCVFMPNENFITISSKIDDKDEKDRLIKIAKKYIPENTGLILRTSSVNKSEDEIKEDLEKIIERWNQIQSKFNKNAKTPKLIYNSFNVYHRMIIDMIDKDVQRIIVNSEEVYEDINEFLLNMTNIKTVVELRKENLLDMYDIRKTIEETEKRKIWLKCGGFITIDKTEALTAIDVNSGKYIGKDNLEKTVLKVNKDASVEIARQIRLRDIGGIIIIDYIDMNKEEHKEEIVKILAENLKNDRAKTQIVGFSKLNLLEMTRKHLHS